MDILAMITPWSCVDERFTAETDRLTVRLNNTEVEMLRLGDYAAISGFGEMGFRDGVAEYVRKDYLGENVARCAFRRVKV